MCGKDEVVQVIKGSKLGMGCCAQWSTPRTWMRYRSVRRAGRQGDIGSFKSMLAPSVWRQMEEMSLCSHPQDPQRIQPVTGQAHTRRVERGVAAMERAVRQRSSGTMEGCRRCYMLPHFPPWPLHARSSSSKKLKGVTALCLPRHMLLGDVGADPCCLPVAVGPRGGCFERWRTG